uniref:AlNc14C13G1570 protein n=1 Tax=Albugo laibachii Nc14 TaxID=890382 RepID=F0W3K8_9STRA|nr:AlNc14C13G1570 [Albugo laibachii Nc14]|eukprot:CCA15651.1 AlNc14C13G1570 [Albugo laibachii Nc14]
MTVTERAVASLHIILQLNLKFQCRQKSSLQLTSTAGGVLVVRRYHVDLDSECRCSVLETTHCQQGKVKANFKSLLYTRLLVVFPPAIINLIC